MDQDHKEAQKQLENCMKRLTGSKDMPTSDGGCEQIMGTLTDGLIRTYGLIIMECVA